MRSFTLAAMLACTFGCTHATQEPADAEFASRWKALAASGTELFYVEQERGQGLLGSVHRAGSPPPVEAPAGAAQRPGLLGDQDVSRLIRGRLSSVKHCYMLEEQSGNTASGKAIITFKITPGGGVEEVRVDAPAFSRSQLPACVINQVRSWQFPKFAGEAMTVSYPFVFVGG
jgi:hypothetical protein